MTDPEDGLSLPVVEDWPGRGTSAVGFGSIGGLVWGTNGQPIYARQNKTRRLVNDGMRQIAEPIQPEALSSHGNSGVNNTFMFLDSTAYGGLPETMLVDETYDTTNTTSGVAIDPQVGQRIYEVDPRRGTFVFADDNYAFLVENEEIVRTVDLCSPVLQVDKAGLVRTRRGIATINAYGEAEYLSEGSYMHATSKGIGGEEALATTLGGTIMLFDVETNTRKWKQTMNRGSLSRWSHVVGLENPATILWCNRYEMALIDLREKPKRRQKALSILHYTDRMTEIRGVDAGFHKGNDVFALTSNDLLWISATPSKPMHPTLSEKHLQSSEDASLSLYRGSYDSNELVTVSTQMAPMTIVGTFARTGNDNLPISTRDLYFIDAWPSVISQSHITVEHSGGVTLYTVGRNGGLFKQSWVASDGEDQRVRDLPPSDPLPKPNYDAMLNADEDVPHKDYDILDIHVSSKSYQFHWLYRWAFKHIYCANEMETGDIDQPLEIELEHGIRADDQLRNQLEQAWLDPLEERAATNEVHPQALRSRQRAIDLILRDLSNKEDEGDIVAEIAAEGTDKLSLPPSFRDMVESWKVNDERDNMGNGFEAMSQPTQIPDFQLSQPTQPLGFAGSFSQPVPMVPSLKVSKRHKGDKKTKKKQKLRH